MKNKEKIETWSLIFCNGKKKGGGTLKGKMIPNEVWS